MYIHIKRTQNTYKARTLKQALSKHLHIIVCAIRFCIIAHILWQTAVHIMSHTIRRMHARIPMHMLPVRHITSLLSGAVFPSPSACGSPCRPRLMATHTGRSSSTDSVGPRIRASMMQMPARHFRGRLQQRHTTRPLCACHSEVRRAMRSAPALVLTGPALENSASPNERETAALNPPLPPPPPCPPTLVPGSSWAEHRAAAEPKVAPQVRLF